MLDPQSLTLAHLVREMRAQAPQNTKAMPSRHLGKQRALEDLATSYALRANVPSIEFLQACGLAPESREASASFSAPGNVQNIPKWPVAAANPATPPHPTGTPGDALQDGSAISPCEKSENFGWPPQGDAFDESTPIKENPQVAHYTHAWQNRHRKV